MDNITIKLFLFSVLGVIFFGLVLPIVLDKLLMKNIKTKYPVETLIFTFKTPSIFDAVMSFGIGCFLGTCIVLLFLFGSLSQMTSLEKTAFITFCAILPFIALAFSIFLTHGGIVTDKRIISKSFFKIKFWKVNYEFLLSDIENISWNNTYNNIILTLKSGEVYRLGGIRNAKKCYKKLELILQHNYTMESIENCEEKSFYKKISDVIKKHKILVFLLIIFCVSQIKYDSVKITHLENKPLASRIFQASSLLCNGNVLITGGKNPISGEVRKSTEIFNTQTLKFTKGPDMNLAHANHMQFNLSNCDVVIVDNNGIETYDYKLNKFILWKDFKKQVGIEKSYDNLFHLGFIKLNDDIIIVGDNNEKTIKILDANKKKLKKTLYMEKKRTSPGVAALGEYIYIFGGLGEPKSKDYYLKDSIRVNLKTNEIKKIADLKHPRYSFTPIIIDNNKILLIGGDDMYDSSAFPFYSLKKSYIDIDEYDIKEDKITTKAIPNRYISTNLHNTNLSADSLKIMSGCNLLEYNTKTNKLKTLKKGSFWNCNWSNRAQFLTHDKILFMGIKSELDNSSDAIIMEDRK